MDRAQPNKTRGGDADGAASAAKGQRTRTRKRSCCRTSSTTASRPPIRLPSPSRRKPSRRRRSRAGRIDLGAPPAHLMRRGRRRQWRRRPPKIERLSKEELEHELEEGLEGTFPASDPPTATQPVHTSGTRSAEAVPCRCRTGSTRSAN